MSEFFPKGPALAAMTTATLIMTLDTVHAQAVPTGSVSPRSEAAGATLGSDFHLYRNAIAARRAGRGAAPGTLQDSTVLTNDPAPTWGGLSSAWASVDTKFLNGTYSGNSTSLIFGADALLGNGLLVGLIGGYNRSSIDLPSGQKVEATGFSIGPYFSADLSESLTLDGFIAYGEPDYDIDGGTPSGEKLFGNLTLTGYVPLRQVELTPFISIASAREKIPAFTSTNPVVAYAATDIEGLSATIGTGINYAPVERNGRTYLPRAGIEVDFVRNDDGFGNDDTFQTFRVNGGVTILGDNGVWSLGGDVARTSEGTTTVGAAATYIWQF